MRRKAKCHPTRDSHSHGKCRQCYDRKRTRASDHRKKKYGVTKDQFLRMVARQGGVCAICKVRPATDLDHCHWTLIVRGVLCGPCNRAIGGLKDDPVIVRAAYRYLSKWKKKTNNSSSTSR